MEDIKNDLVQEVRNMLNFPFPSICRHTVALDMLSILEKHGYPIPDGLAKAICEGSGGDERALEILKEVDKI
jgi:hypothetical protein